MKKTVRKTTLYECRICRTKYTNKKSAKECESRSLEPKVFKIGDVVRNIVARTCGTKRKQYIFHGKVIKIRGPKPAEIEYEATLPENKVGGFGIHAFQYEVSYTCPRCNKEKTALYYLRGLQFVRSR